MIGQMCEIAVLSLSISYRYRKDTPPALCAIPIELARLTDLRLCASTCELPYRFPSRTLGILDALLITRRVNSSSLIWSSAGADRRRDSPTPYRRGQDRRCAEELQKS